MCCYGLVAPEHQSAQVVVDILTHLANAGDFTDLAPNWLLQRQTRNDIESVFYVLWRIAGYLRQQDPVCWLSAEPAKT